VDGGLLQFDETEAWLAQHGVQSVDPKISSEVGACRAVRVGAPLRDGLLCTGGPPMEGSIFGWGESLFPLLLVAAEGGKLRVLLRVPFAAGPEDQLEPVSPTDPNQGNYLQLAADLAPDGTHLSIHDRPGNGCAEELKQMRDENAKGEWKGVFTPHIKVVERACRSRGTYVWRGGRFLRAGT
jgi:hypothetical protein